MEFRVLGPLEVRRAGKIVPVGSRMERALLGALLAHVNTVVPAARLAEALWADRPPPSERNSLQTYVARLRRRLGAEATLIVTRPPGYAIEVDPGQVDALRFERLVGDARVLRVDDPLGALALLDEACGLWRGPAFAEFAADDVIRAEAARLAELRATALDERVEVLLDLGRLGEAVGELEATVAAEPWRERPHAQLMVALSRAGRQVDALRLYRRYRDRLAEEVGLEPSVALRGLEDQILRQAPGFGPASHPVPPPTGNLPAPATSFVGREREVTELTAVVGSSRVVTLVGPGGVGKTRLALEVAVAVSGAFRDRTWVAELAPVGSGDAVAHAVAAVLGVQQLQGRSIEASVADFLHRRHLLLVLDNCEHVIDAAARLVGTLVSSCPELVILATSRERLAVDGERVWAVPPLPVPGRAATGPEAVGAAPAAALFLDRARAARADFRIDRATAAAVAAICRGLDGLPLAIELAAARMQALTAGDLAERLGQRFAVLTAGPRADDGRHRTLRAVVDWSYGLLDESERRVFERLSVFAGDFALDDAVAVCAGDDVASGHVVALVAGLVDKSMVVGPAPSGAGRYAMLETLRQYSAERLAARGEDGAVRRRHAERFLAVAEEADTGLTGPDERLFVDRLRSEIDNLREAHAWCCRQGQADLALRLSVALHRFAWRQVHDEIPTWAAAAVALPGAVGHPLLPQVHGAAGLGACRRGDLAGAVRQAEAGLAAATGPDDPARGLPFEILADVWSFSGRLDEAFDAYGEAARLARLVRDEDSLVYRLVGQALTRAYPGDVHTALALTDEIEGIARSNGNPTAKAWALYTRGESLLEADPTRALGLLEQSLDVARVADNVFVTGVALLSATSLRGRHGEPISALGSYRDAIEHWHRHGSWTQQWITLRNLIELLARVGAGEAAAAIYGATTTSLTAPPTFGPEAQRLQAVVTDLGSMLGSDAFDTAVRQGAAMSDDDVVAYAAGAIGDILTADPALAGRCSDVC